MQAPIKKKMYCKYPGCKNAYSTNMQNKRYHQFPSDPVVHQLWKDICQIEISINASRYVICGDHFAETDFTNENRKRLIPGACPIRNLIANEQLTFEPVDKTFCTCPSTSTSIASCDCFHSENSEVINSNSVIVIAHDHNYATTINSNSVIVIAHDHNYATTENSISNTCIEVSQRCDQFSFLNNNQNTGILSKIGVSKCSELNERENEMYKIHRNVSSKLCKLKTLLNNERDNFKVLSDLYKNDRFQFIDNNLNSVTKDFINSQLRNVDCKPCARRWTDQDKAFALSIYKKSPRLYRYLQSYFQLPSVRTLKSLLAKIPFDTGINSAILEHLSNQVSKMKNSDKICALMFDEISLSEGFQYVENNCQKIVGFEDLGSLGRQNNVADHALVFMLRGLRKQWKQVIAYYFTSKTISSINLKAIVKYLIGQLQDIGLNVVATVCDQGPTNQSALTQLCEEPNPKQSSFYFLVNSQPIVTIYDVPHLLKNTRNALLTCELQFDAHKSAKFEYIKTVFDIDQKKSYKALPKLRPEHFNFGDSYLKMKVKVAAAQLSSSVACAIETFSIYTKELPKEAIFTSEFVQLMDNLFDSLNGSKPFASDCKPFRCALRENTPHWDLWSKLIISMNDWKLINIEKQTDWTKKYSFIRGWQTTMRSVMFLWNRLKDLPDFNYLSLRNLNQDPLENLFSSIRQHGSFNTNPTCHQFTAALKTVVVNKLVAPTSEGNCELDNCTPLDDLGHLLKYGADLEQGEDSGEGLEALDDQLFNFPEPEEDQLAPEDSQGLAYVAGYILKKVNVPECDVCNNYFFTKEILPHHVYTSFKECGDGMRLTYASERVMSLVQNIHENLYSFLDKYGHQVNLEDHFKSLYKSTCVFEPRICEEHDCVGMILDRCVRFLIFKYVKDRRKRKNVSDGHLTKVKRFKSK